MLGGNEGLVLLGEQLGALDRGIGARNEEVVGLETLALVACVLATLVAVEELDVLSDVVDEKIAAGLDEAPGGVVGRELLDARQEASPDVIVEMILQCDEIDAHVLLGAGAHGRV